MLCWIKVFHFDKVWFIAFPFLVLHLHWWHLCHEFLFPSVGIWACFGSSILCLWVQHEKGTSSICGPLVPGTQKKRQPSLHGVALRHCLRTAPWAFGSFPLWSLFSCLGPFHVSAPAGLSHVTFRIVSALGNPEVTLFLFSPPGQGLASHRDSTRGHIFSQEPELKGGAEARAVGQGSRDAR